MNLIIRNEEIKDYKKTEEITREAFWNLYIPGCEEHFLLHKIRKHKDFIKELSFVAELDGEIVGTIVYTHSKIICENGKEYKTITFGPVSILPKYHRKGIGKKLITHSIEKAKNLGYRAIIIGGYEYHYKPYGFVGSKKYGLYMPDRNFYKGIMVLPLYEDALNDICGSINFSDAMEVDKNQLEEFDKNFEYKEKFFKESQKKYELAIAELDKNLY